MEKRQRGITLIALVVTIIVIIILATIAINAVINGGIISRTESSKELHEEQQELERLEIEKASVVIDKKGKVTVDDYINQAIEDGITTEGEVTDNGDESKTIITDNGYVVTISPNPENEDDIIIQIDGKSGALPVRIVGVNLTADVNSIKVDVEAKRAEGGTYEYWYQVEGQSEYVLAHKGEETSYTIDGLTQDTPYRIKVVVTNEAGSSATKEATTRTLKVVTIGASSTTVTAYVGGEDAKVDITGENLGTLSISEEPNSKVATAKLDGKSLSITPVGEGNTTVTVKEAEQNKTVTINVIVKNVTFGLNETSGTGYVGGSNLEATITGSNYGTLTPTSDKESVATAKIEDGKLIITPVGEGTATITITEGNTGKTATYAVTVKNVTFGLNETSGTGYVGGSNLETTITGSNYGTLTPTSDKESVATAKIEDGKLIITPVGEGTATITITEGNTGKTATYAVTVLPTSISVSPTSGETYVGISNLTATITENNMGTLTATSSDTNIATASIEGTTLTIAPVGEGTATITIKGSTCSKTATYKATIKKDTTPPTATITLSSEDVITIEQNITAEVIQTDDETGVDITKCKYIFSTESGNIGTDSTLWNDANTFKDTTETITFSPTTSGIYYVHVLTVDNAGNMKETVKGLISVEEISVPMEPEVTDGMTRVVYNEETEKWERVGENEKWYDYSEDSKQWANVVLSAETDGSLIFNDDGSLDEESNYVQLVWIPRYAYKITSQYHEAGGTAGNIDIVFIDTSNRDKAGNTYIRDTAVEYPDITSGGMDDYVVHPAFDYGEDHLSGFWMGKFESSNTNCTKDYSSGAIRYTGSEIMTVKPNVTSWRYLNIGEAFEVCLNMNEKTDNPYGLSTDDSKVDPHMCKNDEWGAVAYLSQSKYGKNSEVYINNSSDFITGNSGGSTSANSASGTTHAYNTTNGVQASTTGNITGVYDMSGGARDYVAAYVNSGSSNLTSYGGSLGANGTPNKYRNVYSVGSSDTANLNSSVATPANGHYGDAVWETTGDNTAPHGGHGWYNAFTYMSYAGNEFFSRGGACYHDNNAGPFAYQQGNGVYSNDYGFRLTMAVKNKDSSTVGLVIGAINFGSLTWTEGLASVSIEQTTTDDYTIEYMVTSSDGTVKTNYTELENGGTVSNLELGDVVTARLTKGADHGNTTTLNVQDVGKPSAEMVASNITTKTTDDIITIDSITAEVTQTDKESGVDITKCKYIYNTTSSIIGITSDLWDSATSFTTTPETITLTSDNGEDYYLHVLTVDKAGNKKETLMESVVAAIGNKGYTKLQNAIDAVSTDNTQTEIILLKDISENVTTKENQNIVLNLNSHTIQSAENKDIISQYGTLEIKNGTVSGSTSPEIRNYDNANLSISSGEITCQIANAGILEIGGTANISSRIWNLSGGTAIITGGEITATKYSAINNYGTLEISGLAKVSSTSSSYETISNQSKGTATITGGEVTSTSYYAISNVGTLEISETAKVSSTATSYATVYNQSNGTATITGGEVTSASYYAISNVGTLEISETAKISSTATSYATVYNQSKGTATITGGEVTSASSSAISNYGTLEISETAKISSESSLAVYNASGGTATLTGGEMMSTSSNAINNYGTLEIGGTAKVSSTAESYPTVSNQSDATLTMIGGTITATSSYAIRNKSGGTATITGGTITSESSYGIGNESDATLTITGGTITSTSSYAVYNKSGGNVRMTGGEVSSPSGSSVCNYGTLEISGTAKINTTSSYATVYNESDATLTMTGGTITATSSIAVWNKSGGTATITGGTISSQSGYAIYNSGTASVSGASISGITYGI